MGQKILTGANLVVYLNSRPYGVVQSFSWNEDTPSDAIGGVDTPNTVELASTTSSVSGSMTIWRLAADGGLEGAGMKTTSANLARGKYFSLLVRDRVTDQIFFHASKCRVGKQSWSAQVKAMVSGTVAFQALDCDNEVANAKVAKK